MKKWWIIMALLLALGMTAALAEDTTDPEAYQVGNTVFFGNYEQDNLRNGAEPIEWIVLDVQDGKALLLSQYGLDLLWDKDYTDHYIRSWEDCAQREWLNDYFWNTAFSETEQAAILLTDLDNGDEVRFNKREKADEKDTQDRVFLLSFHEAVDLYFSSYDERKCKATAHAAAADTNGVINKDGYGYWFLRSPGHFHQATRRATIDPNGKVFSGLMDVEMLVRPAMWIDLNAFRWTCPVCGHENDGAFCPWCGAKKPEPEEAAPVVCPGCGAEYPADTEYMFCKKCGTKLEKEEADKPEETEPVDPAEAIKGSWSLTDVKGDNAETVASLKAQMAAGYEQRMKFTAKTLEIYARLEYQETTLKGTYTLDGNKLTMKFDGWDESQTVEYTIDGNILEVDYGEYILVFKGNK